MKSSSERTLPSAVSSRPDTSSRTGAATSTVTRAAERGMFEPGVIAVMPGERASPLCRSLTKRPIRRTCRAPGGCGPGALAEGPRPQTPDGLNSARPELAPTAPPRSCGPPPPRTGPAPAGTASSGMPVADEDLRVQDAGREQLGGALVAVQHRHRAGDGDLLVVDAVRVDRRPGSRSRPRRTGGTCPPSPTRPRPSWIARRVARGVDDHVPALRPVQLVRVRRRPPRRRACRAVASRSGLRSTTSTLAAPVRLASSSIIRPIVPEP